MTTQEVRQSPRFFYGYIIVLVCFIIVVVFEALLNSFGVFFKPLLTEFGWTRAMTSGAFSLAGTLKIPITVVAGKLSDRFGAKQVLAACGFFFGLGYLLMSQVNTIWQLYLFYGVIAGIGMGLYWVPVMSVVPRWFVERRALMLGIVTSGIGVGQLTVPLLSWLIYAYGWRTSFLIIGSMCMGIIIISTRFLRRYPQQMGLFPYGESGEKQESSIEKPKDFSLHEALRTKQFWMFCMIILPWMFCMSAVLVHIVIYAIGLGISPASAANVLAIIGVTGIIGRLAFGRLADVIGIKPVLIACLAVILITFLWLLIAGEMWMVYLFAAVFGISYGGFEVLETPILAELFGLRSLGAIFGVAFGIATIGFVLGPIVTGYIFDVTSSYQVAFQAFVALAFISLTSASLLPLRRGRREKPNYR